MKTEIWKRPEILVGLVCSAVFICLLAILSYSAGYGKEVDGVVVYSRDSLIQNMFADYRRDDGEWSFGYFVPFAVGGLFWLRRKELIQTNARPAVVTGFLILLVGFFLYWAGYRGEQKYFGYASLQILVLGMIVWFLGWKWFRQLFWLWVLLGMMWPWRFLIGRISAPLQSLMVQLTTAFLNVFGVDAVASGSSLKTATLDPISGIPISLDVDVACSGMRSLFALIMIGLVFAFLRVKEEWKRWLLMALVPVVAILGNFVRMLMLYGGSLVWGTEFAIGKNHEMSLFHLLAGLVVFVVALAVMSGVVHLTEQKGLFQRRKKKQVVRRSVGQTATEGGES